ncbi:MAG: DUF4157 domain-containing protein, partial [Thermoleophilia bacterium]|nr:DUF4157 domain-containing protein [Thermoleophilia bacterium]
MTIDARSRALPVLPWRVPDEGDSSSASGTMQSMPLLPHPPRADHAVTASEQSENDPLRPPGPDGWTPDTITPVRSRNEGGFIGSALNFTLGGVDEHPGQRLSTAQVDALAPFYATEFGLDEGYVRSELAKVYVYIGGPSVGGQAMTIGHHIYVRDEKSLRHILAPGGRRWLAHELSHTMQFLSYDGGSPHQFLADYFNSMIVGRDPQTPGTGKGPLVWGALFTGLRTLGHPESEIGKGSSSLRDTLISTVLPATAISVPVALTAGGGLSALRATSGRRVLGTGSSLGAGFGVIAAPAIAGSLLGAYDDQLGGSSRLLATLAGGALAGGTMLAGGAFGVGGSTAVTQFGRNLGRGTAIGLALAATIGGAAIGLMSSSASVNTMRGWSSSADVLHQLANAPSGEAPDKLGLQDAVHDSHWQEIDAEALARTYVRGEWAKPKPGDPPVQGRVPAAPDTLAGRVDQDVTHRLDWGVNIPLIIGIPAAIGVGAGVLGARTGSTVLRTTIKEGKGPVAAIGAAMELLGSKRKGLGNSMGIGAALTVAPLVAGGLTGPLAYNATGSDTIARL